LSESDRRQRLGVPLAVLEWERLQASRENARPGVLYSYPSTKDWRNVNGQDWTTAIRDQGNCGSCVAFGTVGVIESRLEIVHNNPGLEPDLSEAHLFFCNERSCDIGWWPSAAMNYARDTGIVDEACYPYADHDQTCNLCSNWQSRVTKITRWTGTSNISAMKQALADKGPFEATMTVYTDFFYYSGGIYRYTWGEEEGGHAITIVGYDDNGGYWIAKNSWGISWGEGGWFRIAYGECGIDDYTYIPCLLSGDLDGDKDIDINDIQQVTSHWRQRAGDPGWDARFDVNGDGVINTVDIMKVSAHWGETCK
jgi:C1A family cysteine protease